MGPPTSASPAERFRRIDAMFDAALDLSPEEQSAFLANAAGDDADLRGEVARLLDAYRQCDVLFATSAAELAAPLFESAELLTLAGAPDRIGPWRIVRAIGRGGMGDVYLGERADGQFEQRAALKVIQHGTPSLIRRFLEERRILALLEHPGIARLIEGGLTPGGLPYFAMELVDGVPVDRYCADHDLSLDARLELMVHVCDAVGYAHHHLVIHRDLKPSNILVTPAGRVKLLDFGIAKVLDDGDRTETQGSAMTPEFAAPEQVLGEAVSTATDVYALGALLYFVLTGSLPHDVRDKTLVELAWMHAEKLPTRPSSRMSDPLRRRIRGDLDLIIMTALQREPARRYQSPDALAEDLRRFLKGHPILARPDTAGYRVRKFVGRHRMGVALAASFVVLLALGLGRERVLRHRAETEARKAREVGDYLVSVFDVADPYAATPNNGRDVTARALLERGTRRIDSTLTGQPEVQAEMRGVLGRVYNSLGLYDKSISLLRETLAQHKGLYREPNLTIAKDLDQLGGVLLSQDRYDEAEPLLKDALTQRRQMLGNSDDAVAETLDHLAWLYQRRNEYAAAEPLFREALSIRQRLFGDTADVTAGSLNNLALLLYQRDAYTDAEPLYRKALEIRIRHLGENHPLTAEVLHNMAQTEQRRGKFAAAESLYRRALAAKRRTLGNLHPSVTVNLNNLGELLFTEGRVEEAEPLIREALALDRQIFGEKHSYVAASQRNLGTVLRLKGEFAEAEQYYRGSLNIDRELFGPEHRNVGLDLNNMGNIRRLQGDLPGAVNYLRQAVAITRRTLGDDHTSTIACTVNLGRALEARGDAAEAEKWLRAAARRLDPTNAERLPWYLNAQSGVGRALVAQGHATEARDLLEPVVKLASEKLGEDHLRTADARLALGRALLATREYAKAEPVLRAASAWLESKRTTQPFFAADARLALADLERRRRE
jgi:eukaryotic-like serine/threonine-protein kinase